MKQFIKWTIKEIVKSYKDFFSPLKTIKELIWGSKKK